MHERAIPRDPVIENQFGSLHFRTRDHRSLFATPGATIQVSRLTFCIITTFGPTLSTGTILSNSVSICSLCESCLCIPSILPDKVSHAITRVFSQLHVRLFKTVFSVRTLLSARRSTGNILSNSVSICFLQRACESLHFFSYSQILPFYIPHHNIFPNLHSLPASHQYFFCTTEEKAEQQALVLVQ